LAVLPDQIKVMTDEGAEKNGLLSSDKGVATSTGGNGTGGGGNIPVEGQSSSLTSAVGTPTLRQNSSNSVNSCLVASPNNTSEHSNSSSVSATVGLTQMVDSDEQAKKKKSSVKDEDVGKTALTFAHAYIHSDRLSPLVKLFSEIIYIKLKIRITYKLNSW